MTKSTESVKGRAAKYSTNGFKAVNAKKHGIFMNLKIWLIFAIIALVFIAGCAQQPPPVSPTVPPPVPPPVPPAPPIPPPIAPPPPGVLERSFEMGFVPIPTQPVTTQAWLDAWTLFGSNSDIVLEHANLNALEWAAFQNSSPQKTPSIDSLDFFSGMAGQKSLDMLIVVDPLNKVGREEISDLPPGFGANFGDQMVRTSFKNYAVYIAKNYKPKYLGLGSEINTYLKKRPSDADNFASILKETISEIRKVSPATKITSTFQYESLTGLVDGNPGWETFSKIEQEIDVVSITTYPSAWFNAPDDIPIDYFEKIKGKTSKKIIIAESGWPSGGASNFHGSAENQKRFVEKIPELAKKIDLVVWIWWFPHDWSGEGYPDFFKTMGLKTSTGEPKPAWQAWQKIRSG